jgi:hypothetical protein
MMFGKLDWYFFAFSHSPMAIKPVVSVNHRCLHQGFKVHFVQTDACVRFQFCFEYRPTRVQFLFCFEYRFLFCFEFMSAIDTVTRRFLQRGHMHVVVFRFALWQLQQHILTLFDLVKVFGVLTVVWLIGVGFMVSLPHPIRIQEAVAPHYHRSGSGWISSWAWSDIQTVESEVRADRSSPAERRPQRWTGD